jgi:hypothetical protein
MTETPKAIDSEAQEKTEDEAKTQVQAPLSPELLLSLG